MPVPMEGERVIHYNNVTCGKRSSLRALNPPLKELVNQVLLYFRHPERILRRYRLKIIQQKFTFYGSICQIYFFNILKISNIVKKTVKVMCTHHPSFNND